MFIDGQLDVPSQRSTAIIVTSQDTSENEYKALI